MPGRTRIRYSASAHGKHGRATGGHRAASIQLAIRCGALQQTTRWTGAGRCNLSTCNKQLSAQWAAAVRIAAQVHSNFKACYGVDGTGDIYNSANFRSIVMAKTGGTCGTQMQRARGARTQRTRGAPANDRPAQPTPTDVERLQRTAEFRFGIRSDVRMDSPLQALSTASLRAP